MMLLNLEVAIVPNNNIVEIYNVNGFDPKAYTLDKVFKPEHGALITCVDWVCYHYLTTFCMSVYLIIIYYYFRVPQMT